MRLRNLSYMDISHNDFTGPIPLDWLDQLVRLRFLILDHNRFSGNLPSNFAQLGNGRMRLLYINDNEFTGYFPSGWDDYLTSKCMIHDIIELSLRMPQLVSYNICSFRSLQRIWTLQTTSFLIWIKIFVRSVFGTRVSS